MVKLSQDDQSAIGDAIRAGEGRTAATMSVVVLPVSDHYRDFVFLYGFVLGSLLSLALWFSGRVLFPWLLTIQVAVIVLVEALPWLYRLLVHLVPRAVRHHRAAKMAHRQYLVLHARLPCAEPFALLFVSLAERYVHVIVSPEVHSKIPDNWKTVTDHFIAAVRKDGLRQTSIQALSHMVEILSSKFPAK